jgi:hypothetical protein
LPLLSLSSSSFLKQFSKIMMFQYAGIISMHTLNTTFPQSPFLFPLVLVPLHS